MKILKPVVMVACLAGAAMPGSTETADPEEKSGEGLSQMEQGALLFLEGLQKQLDPAMDELGALMLEMGPTLKGFVEEMGPALTELMSEVEDWSLYHPPEVMPNGDIILRRKSPQAETESETGDGAQTDL